MLTYGTNPHYDRLFDRLNEICGIGALLKHLDDANRGDLDPAALGALGQLIARLSQDAVEDLEKLPQSLQTRTATHETAPQPPKSQVPSQIPAHQATASLRSLNEPQGEERHD